MLYKIKLSNTQFINKLRYNILMVRVIEKKKCKIKRIGNSKGIIIDKDTLEYLNLDIDDWVIISIEKDISKAETTK